ncbi:N-acetylmuramoyl-L-alanine amidase [Rouxiella badensis]|uniref:N-acetylmuramoyl-L-alanine amidase AmiA n=1 Tax=Rouxiella badensis TaxID=1646377 RepID=A0A1X0WBP8_9GAMM|nr:N-acetylmuramoyl-L-alanine amidase [Rouxiella badensis]ORJ24206.1 N-acetylmuramoyl-L-alanine amidase [Rouxiella badensis]WAT03733.1 N-acetylmuramoyl-L-alanine amidase [Rouxiella badensis]
MTINQSRRKLLVFGMGMTLVSPKIFAAQKIALLDLKSTSDSLHITLPANDPHARVFTLDNPDRVVIDVSMTAFSSSLMHSLVVVKQKFPWIVRAKIAHFNPQTARIVFELNQSAKISHQNVEGLKSISVTVAKGAMAAIPAVEKENAQPEPEAYKPEEKISNRPLLVMIDPGHGGKDPGAIGGGGTYEKHVVLDIARHLQQQLQRQYKIHAVLTRQDDVFIPLYHRVNLAHQHEADLFISIHADGFSNDQVSGASVFALSEHGAGSAMARYLSQSENSVDAIYDNDVQTNDAYLKQTLFDLDQTETINRSLEFGKHLATHIETVHHMHNRHIEQAGFVVLKSPRIPSVLVETSFITNHQEEKLLQQPGFQLKMAKALASGIHGYLNQERKENLIA